MHRIESIEDDMNGVVTYEFQNGKRVRFDRHAVEERSVTKEEKIERLRRARGV